MKRKQLGVVTDSDTTPTPGKPTGYVDLEPKDGTAEHYIRSDAAPGLSQAIKPTWSESHTFAKTTYFDNPVSLSSDSSLVVDESIGIYNSSTLIARIGDPDNPDPLGLVTRKYLEAHAPPPGPGALYFSTSYTGKVSGLLTGDGNDMDSWVVSVPGKLEAGLPGSVATLWVAPASSGPLTMNLWHYTPPGNRTSIGSITFDVGSKTGRLSFKNEVPLAVGDVVSLSVPEQTLDSTASGLIVVLKGSAGTS